MYPVSSGGTLSCCYRYCLWHLHYRCAVVAAAVAAGTVGVAVFAGIGIVHLCVLASPTDSHAYALFWVRERTCSKTPKS